MIELAREFIAQATAVMTLLAGTLSEARGFIQTYSQVCATPVYDPSLYRLDLDDSDVEPSA